MITGKDLIALGYEPGAHFAPMLERANAAGHASRELLDDLLPPPSIPPRTNAIQFTNFLEPETEDEHVNARAVVANMDKLLRTPTIKNAVVMPDACPAGTIPVGGVVACEEAIHPGFHSADICCSMAISIFNRREDPSRLLDVAMRASHFGPIKKTRTDQVPRTLSAFENNPFLKGLEFYAQRDFMTQGDGNHFFYVGEFDGQTVIVTHHGSRGLGAQLYRRGKACAERMTRKIAPKVPASMAWIPSETDEGRAYWDALQLIRLWTRENHFAIHDTVARQIGNKVRARSWNEHNFVFRRSDGLFYHAKGATPSYSGYAEDDDGITLIPMNMGREILVTGHTDNPDALGFAPHGAGRTMSRSEHMRRLGDVDPVEQMHKETEGLDIRFYTGKPDVSELPSAYKRPDSVIGTIQRQNLAKVDGLIQPQGSIMAGHIQWRRK